MENLQENQIYLREAENPSEWQAILRESENAHYLQSWEWGEFKEERGWKPSRYLICCQDKAIGAVQILTRRAPFLGKLIAYAPRGPLLKKEVLENPELAKAALLKIKEEVFRQEAVFLFKIDPWIEKGIFAQTLSGLNALPSRPVQMTDCTIILNLKDPALFSKNARYYIRNAREAGVKILKDNTGSGIESFLELYLLTGKRAGIFLRKKDYLFPLLEKFINKKMAEIYFAEWQGKRVSAAVVFRLDKNAWYAYGGSARIEEKKIAPSYLLQAEIIEDLKSKGIEEYDLGGVPCRQNNQDAELMRGLLAFKSNFGGKYTEFAGSFDIPSKKLYHYYKLWKKTEPFVKKYLKIFKRDLFY